ncbi:MAG TPA: TlpA disulfide reductase family protein [Candidatus Acidoferrum sp.]|jgi:cytochrome c biogenesis protein CcmG/thiol:disulfide interchange protein DsbE|nr:TlpA disulfide reductase family protein [Candidatus Acidoferrum sp.]
MIESGGARDLVPAQRPVPKWALALPVLVVVVATVTGVALTTLDRSSGKPSVSPGLARVGGMAPDFTSWDLSGKKVSLADFKGDPVLITFWATWCTACQGELPTVQRIRDQFSSNGFHVLAVNYRETSSSRMSQYLAGLHVNLEAVIDPEGTIASAYGVDIGLPISVLLDRTGTVVQIWIGAVTSAALETAVGQVATPAST